MTAETECPEVLLYLKFGLFSHQECQHRLLLEVDV